jgi:hypothetical protein
MPNPDPGITNLTINCLPPSMSVCCGCLTLAGHWLQAGFVLALDGLWLAPFKLSASGSQQAPGLWPAVWAAYTLGGSGSVKLALHGLDLAWTWLDPGLILALHLVFPV